MATLLDLRPPGAEHRGAAAGFLFYPINDEFLIYCASLVLDLLRASSPLAGPRINFWARPDSEIYGHEKTADPGTNESIKWTPRVI